MPTRTVSLVLDGRGAPRAVRVPTIRLRVVKGPDKGKDKRVATTRLLIGTGEGADLRLTDDTVSAVHCELNADASGFHLKDLGAKNGVTLGGRKVKDAWLQPKDTIELGRTELRFTLTDESEEHALPTAGLGRLKGTSVAMREVYRVLARAAQSDAPTLIRGETGTGKELAAEALVNEGPRRDAPLVVVDCGQLTTQLAESELFGHEKGAFTGATREHAGAFERANGGTLFLDEVGELPLELQPKLLGALERKQVQRLGGNKPIALDVRVIAATHRDLEQAVNRGTFRSDLYYRLAAIEVRLPPLSARSEDVPLLVGHFLEQLPKAVRLPTAVLRRLYDGDYPGNVRELKNAVERAALGLESAAPAGASPAALKVDLGSPFPLEKEKLLFAFEREYFGKQLEACGGNIAEAARRSGISRVYLSGLVRRLGLVATPPRYTQGR